MTYSGDPAKDIGVERKMMLGKIKSSLNQNLPLERTAVVCDMSSACAHRAKNNKRTFDEIIVFGDISKQGMKLCVASTTRDGVPGTQLTHRIVEIALDI